MSIIYIDVLSTDRCLVGVAVKKTLVVENPKGGPFDDVYRTRDKHKKPKPKIFTVHKSQCQFIVPVDDEDNHGFVVIF